MILLRSARFSLFFNIPFLFCFFLFLNSHIFFHPKDYFDEVIQLTEEYVTASLSSVDGNATNLRDTTVLMEVFL